MEAESLTTGVLCTIHLSLSLCCLCYVALCRIESGTLLVDPPRRKGLSLTPVVVFILQAINAYVMVSLGTRLTHTNMRSIDLTAIDSNLT